MTLADALDCQRLICVTRNIPANLLALQHEAEAAGLQVHFVHDARGLSQIVTADDDLIVLAEGLLADPPALREMLIGGAAVLVQPIEAGLAAGFERIDLNRATAGAMRIPGRMVEGLAELPPDCDIPSALTRVALQGGIAMKEVPTDLRSGVRWRLIRSESDVEELEAEWIGAHIGDTPVPTPGYQASRFAVSAFGAGLLHAGHASRSAFLLGLGLLLVAMTLGWFGLAWPALTLLVLASICGRTGGMFQRVERGSGAVPSEAAMLDAGFGWLLDVVLVLVAVWASPLQPWESLFQRAFAPLMLVLAVRLAAHALPTDMAVWLEDRVLLAVGLAIFAAFEVISPGIELLAVVVMLAAIILSRSRTKLT
ncbi:MAG: hypothetical protein KDE55_21200 [Novosphingobium sp.]|nr:hypothetical protein [Novosphingobium sp.]